jgi:hypothetical protein
MDDINRPDILKKDFNGETIDVPGDKIWQVDKLCLSGITDLLVTILFIQEFKHS